MRKRDRLKRGGKRFSKFSVVGLSNAVVDIGVLNLFLWLQPTRDPMLLVLFNGVALVLANTNSYVWNSLWTFRGRADHGPRQTVLFALQALVNIAVSNGLFWALIRPLLVETDIPVYLVGNTAKIISIVVASTISYFIMRYLVFSRRRWFNGRL
ncbi:MAG: GtrA family protein [Actinomycetota bacterium]|nr:GtrA family protein [Actinomycetota bacterium]